MTARLRMYAEEEYEAEKRVSSAAERSVHQQKRVRREFQALALYFGERRKPQ